MYYTQPETGRWKFVGPTPEEGLTRIRYSFLFTGVIWVDKNRVVKNTIVQCKLHQPTFMVGSKIFAMCTEQKRRRGRPNLETLLGTFIIVAFVRIYFIIFFYQQLLWKVFYMYSKHKLNCKFVDKQKMQLY